MFELSRPIGLRFMMNTLLQDYVLKFHAHMFMSNACARRSVWTRSTPTASICTIAVVCRKDRGSYVDVLVQLCGVGFATPSSMMGLYCLVPCLAVRLPGGWPLAAMLAEVARVFA